jgi:hypothetical protein
MTNKPGIPDLLCLKAGEPPLFIEVKAHNGRLSALQNFRSKELIERGFDVWLEAAEK